MKALTWIGIVLTLLSAISFLSIVSSGVTQGTATPIKHVIFIELENHAFDSIYGTYPFGYPVIINNITMSVMRPVNYIYNLSLLNILSQAHGNVTWISVPAGNGYLHPITLIRPF